MHQQKCGGTDIIRVLSAAGVRYDSWNDNQIFGLSTETKGSRFVVSSVRNPCSYLLSVWAYQVLVPAMNNPTYRAAMPAEFWSGMGKKYYQNDSAKFAAWFRSTMLNASHSIMTYRFYQRLVAQKNFLPAPRLPTNIRRPQKSSLNGCQRPLFQGCASNFNDSLVERGLRSFWDTSLVDCWVFLESLCVAARTCNRTSSNHPFTHPYACGVLVRAAMRLYAAV